MISRGGLGSLPAKYNMELSVSHYAVSGILHGETCSIKHRRPEKLDQLKHLANIDTAKPDQYVKRQSPEIGVL